MTSPEEPQRPNQDGVAPKNRFATFEGLWSEYRRAVDEHMKSDIRFSEIRGIFDRLPPENPEYLRSQGLEDMPNFNLGEFTAKVESYVSTWVDHNTGGYKFFDVKLNRKKENPPEVSDYYDEKVTEFFNEAITEWDDDAETQSASPYIMESCIRDLQMGLFGIGLSYFPDDMDWRFQAIPTRKALVPQGTKLTLRNCPVLFLPTESTVTEIYKKVMGDNAQDGWNKKAVFRMLYEKTAEEKQGSREEFSDWENRRRNNDSFLHSNFSPVDLVDCYVQEFSSERQKDGISHYVIARSGTPTEILFEKDRQYGSFGQFIKPFSDNTGPEGDWHGVKGFGDAIYDNCHFQNQFFNHMSRSALIGNMPMFSLSSESDKDKASQFKWTFMGLMTPGLTPQQVNIRTDLNGMMGVFQASQRTVNTNSRTYPTGESLGQEAKTATQSTFDRQDQAKLSTLQIKMYRMSGLDPLGAEMYRRLVQSSYPKSLPGGRAAESFRKKCEEAVPPIPKECYQHPKQVTADRTGGTGNQALDAMIADQVFAISTPGRGQINARRLKAKALVGSDRVEEFVQAEQTPQEQQGIIDLENSDLSSGQTFPAREFQDHVIHLGEIGPEGQGHFAVLLTIYQQASQMAKAGAIENALPDAQKLDRALEGTLSHVAMHVQFLEKYGITAYQQAAKDMNKVVNDMAQFLQTFRQQIGAAMEKQQPQGPQMSAKDQAILMTAQVKAEVERALAQQRMQFKEADQMQKLGNMAERSAAKTEIQLTEKQQKMIMNQAEFDQRMGQSAVETMTEMEIARAANTRAQANAEQTTE